MPNISGVFFYSWWKWPSLDASAEQATSESTSESKCEKGKDNEACKLSSMHPWSNSPCY